MAPARSRAGCPKPAVTASLPKARHLGGEGGVGQAPGIRPAQQDLGSPLPPDGSVAHSPGNRPATRCPNSTAGVAGCAYPLEHTIGGASVDQADCVGVNAHDATLQREPRPAAAGFEELVQSIADSTYSQAEVCKPDGNLGLSSTKGTSLLESTLRSEPQHWLSPNGHICDNRGPQCGATILLSPR